MPISFTPVGTFGNAGTASLQNPTSLQFGPDGRLYVSEQNGSINAFTVEKQGSSWVATGGEQLEDANGNELVKNIQNHNDDGSENNGGNRQVTGIVVGGTAENPVLYISSSDPQIASNGEKNLDTNSGVVSRATWDGTQWVVVDLVRGLPRSEENHSVNGMLLSEDGNSLLLQVGGNTNNGAPSSFFSFTNEYVLSGSVLELDLVALDALPDRIDPQGGQNDTPRTFKYDLPTLDDPNIENVTDGQGEDEFGMDESGPWGGNDGLNMAILPADAPLRVYADGNRNAYDLARAPNGQIFSVDNGSNGGLGGAPATEGVGVDLDGDGITNEAIAIPSSGSFGEGEPLIEIVEGGYYYHANPIRSNQNQSWTVYDDNGNPDGSLETSFVADLSALVPDAVNMADGFLIDPSRFAGLEGLDPNDPADRAIIDARLFLSGQTIDSDALEQVDPDGGGPGQQVIEILGSSTNGIMVYDSGGTAFNGAIDGKIFVTQFNDNITLLNINEAGTQLEPIFEEGPDGIFGTADDVEQDADGVLFVANTQLGVPLSNPLDVVQGPEGTLWVAEIGSNEITILAPSVVIDPTSDDSDNDGILNPDDPFLRDASNGTSVTISPDAPTVWEFSQGAGNTTPGPDGFGGGLTGVMVNGTTDYEAFFQSPRDPNDPNNSQIQLDNVKFVTAAGGGTTTIEQVSEGDPYLDANDGEFLFHTGFQLAANVETFTVKWVVANPGAVIGGSDITESFQQIGGYIGDGTQSNYLKIVAIATGNPGSGTANIQIALENGDTISSSIDLPANDVFNNAVLVPDSSIVFELEIDPGAATAIPTATFSTTSGDVTISGGPSDVIDLTGSAVLDTILGNNTVNGNQTGIATGLFASNNGSPNDTFQAVFDSITVTATEAEVAPVAGDDSAFTGVGVTLTIPVAQLLLNDTDANTGDLLTITEVSNPLNGTVSLDGGIVTFIPTPGFSGDASFDYTLSDGTAAGTDTGSVDISVADKVVLYRVNAGGAEVAALADDPVQLAWGANTGQGAVNVAPDGVSVNTGNISTHSIANQNDPGARDASLPDYVPYAVFNQERWDLPAAPEMLWNFDVTAGATYEVNLFVRNGFAGTSAAGERVFDITIEGTEIFSNIDLSGTYGTQTAAMLTHTLVVEDDLLDIEFLHDFENPLINAIEIVQVGAVPPAIPTIDIVSGDQTVGENGGQVLVSILASETVPAGPGLSFTYVIEGVSATPEDDYAPAEGLIGAGTATFTGSGIIAGGSSDFQIPIDILQDTEIEPNETFTVTITGVGPGYEIGASSATITIEDDDTVIAPSNVLFRINSGGDEVIDDDGGPNWSADTEAAPTPFLVSGGENTFASNATINTTTLPDVPAGIFGTERWDEATPGNEPEMNYEFTVQPGVYVVNLYVAEGSSGQSSVGARNFDVAVEGVIPAVFDDIDPFAFAQANFGDGNAAFVLSHTVSVNDGTLDLDFLHDGANNPAIRGIEIVAADDLPPTPAEITIAAPDPATEVEGGDVGVTTLDFAVSFDKTPDAAVTLQYSVAVNGVVTPGLTLDLGTADGVISVEVPNDDADNGTESVVVTLTAVTAGGAAAVLGANASASGSVTEDDVEGPAPGQVLYRVNVGGPAVIVGADDSAAPNDPDLDWGGDTGNFGTAGNSPYLAANSDGGSTYNSDAGSSHPGDATFTDPSIPAGTPGEIFQTERYDLGSSDPEMLWQFPVQADFGLQPGDQVIVRLYFAELFGNITAAGQRSFDVSVEGVVPVELDDVDPFATAGANAGYMIDTVATLGADGVLDIEFLHDLAENPAVKGIEILALEDTGVYVPPLDDLFGTSVEISDDRLAPTDADTLDVGDNFVTATQEGPSGDNAVRDRDYFTFTIPEGSVLTGIFLDGYTNGNPASPDGFLAIQQGDQLTVDPETGQPDAGTDGLLGAVIYGSGSVGANLLDTMAAGGVVDPATGFTLDPFDPALSGDVTVWLNQGAGPGTPTLRFVVSEPEATGSAVLSINNNSNGIEVSNFGNGSFTITNNGEKDITSIEIDVTDALFPDAVFDPLGIAGDTTAKVVTLNNGSDGGTGLVVPAGGFGPGAVGITYLGAGEVPGQEALGFERLRLEFNDFNPNETIQFGVDMDPNSIAGAVKSTLDPGAPLAGAGNWDIGGIAGAELAGSLFTVNYADGTSSQGKLQGQGTGQQSGAKALSTQASENLSVNLTVNGLGEGDEGSYAAGGPQILIEGPAGEMARVLVAKGFIVPFFNNFPETNPYNATLDSQLRALEASGFPANNAVELLYVDVLLDGNVQDISGLFDFTQVAAFDLSVPDGFNEYGELDEAKLPLGIVASVIDTETDLSKGAVTSPIHLTFAENAAPIITDPGTQTVDEGGALSLQIDATDLEANTPLTYALEVLDADGLTVADPAFTIDPVTGLITGTAPAVLEETGLTARVTVTDSLGAASTIDVPLVIADAVPDADLSLSKTVDDPTPAFGDDVVFTVTVNNAGDDDAPGVAVRDLLPSGFDFVSADSSLGTYDDATGIWTLGTVASGTDATLTLTATVLETLAPEPDTVLYRVNAGGDSTFVVGEVDSIDASDPDWLNDTPNGSLNGNATTPPSTNILAPGISRTGGQEFGDENGSPVIDTSLLPVDTAITAGILETERFGVPIRTNTAIFPEQPKMEWDFTVANGDYTVNLYFAELFATTTGQRLFDVEIEGDLVLDDYDIFADVGGNTGVLKSFDVSVADENLDIDFTTVVDNAKISAIEIIQKGAAATEDPDYTSVAEIIASDADDPDSTPDNNDPAEDDQASVVVTPSVAGQNGVSVVVTTDASEAGTTGVFTVALDEAAATDTVVSYTVTGSATAGGDYVALAGSVTIPAGALSAAIEVTAIDNLVIEGDESVTLTLDGITSGDANVVLSLPATASMIIEDDDVPNEISIVATQNAAEPTTDGIFTVTLTEAAETDTVISYSVAGTAEADVDYLALSGTVTIPAGELSATIEVSVVEEDEIEGLENVVVTLDAVTSGDANVVIGATGSSSLDIADDDVNFGATVTVNGSTTFGNGAFEIVNTSDAGVKIVNISFDIGTATMSLGLDLDGKFLGSVWDPTTEAGDAGGQGIILNPAVGNQVGFLDASGAEAATGVNITTSPYPFDNQLLGPVGPNGTPGGFQFMNMDFTNFDVGELLKFGVDVDPQSIQNAFGTGEAGAISGAEIAGTTVRITFEDENGAQTTLSRQLEATGLNSSSAVFDRNDASPAPVLTVVGLTGAARRVETSEPNQVVEVTGVDAGATVELYVFDASGYEKDGGNGTAKVSSDPFHANNLDAAPTILQAIADASGKATFLVDISNGVDGAAPASVDDLFFLAAGQVDADGNLTSLLSEPAELKLLPPPPGGFSADFEFGTEGFTYADGAFRSTDEDSFEDGVATGGVLRVILGGGSGRDTITGMSGGWTTSFESAAGQAASLDLVYRIAMTAELDLEEIAEVLVSLDGSEFFVASLEATDSENEVLDTGFVEATLDLGTLDAGTHTLTIGGFLNQRTRSNEIATLEFESLELTLGAPPPVGNVLSIAAEQDAAEPAQEGSFRISLTEIATADVTVNFTVGGTADQGDDYVVAASATIPAGQISTLLDVTLIDDLALEGDETVTVTLTNVTTADPDVVLGDAVTASIVIADDDVANALSVATTDANAAEPNVPGQFTVSLERAATTDTEVSYTVGGTATSGADFTPLSGSVVIAAGELAAVIDVAILDDTIEEGAETVSVTLSGATGDANVVLGAADTASFTIADDDVPNAVSVATSANGAEPGTDGQFTVALNLVSDSDVTVTYSLGGTADAGSDYGPLTGTVTIPAGALSAAIDLEVLDDLEIEGNESVEITLTGLATDDQNVVLGAQTGASLVIADDDTPNAVSIGSVIDAVEPDQSGSATLSLERAALTDTTVTYTVAGTATSGTDYAALTGTAVILAGTTSTQIEIAPIDDLVQEGVETVALTLTGASGDASIRLGSATSAIVAIGDDEAPPPGGFSADFEFGTEGFTYADGAFRSTDEDSFEDGVATGGVLRVILGGGSGRDTITGMSGGWTTSFESAAGQAASLDLVYRIAMTAELDLEEIAEVLVSLDGSEFFVASLEATDSENEVLDTGFVEATLDLGTLDAGTHTLTIGGFLNQRTRSNEIATLEFESLELTLGAPPPVGNVLSIAAEQDAAEPAQEGSFRISLTEIATADVTVNFTVGGTADQGDDYVVAASATIPAGQISTLLDVTLIDDLALEGDETVTVTLTNVTTADPDVVLGDAVTASIVIADDDVANALSVATTDANAAEPNVPGQFTVSLERAATTDTEVSYTVGGTATSGADFTPLSGSVVIAAGELAAVIDVAILDDTIEEGAETVSVTLSGATGDANVVLGAADTASFTIADDDVPNAVSVATSANGAEPGTDGQFTVALNLVSDSDVTVTYSLGGTADAGSDYGPLTGTVTIPAGALSAAIDLEVLDDLEIEGNESVEITLTGLATDDQNVVLGAQTGASLVIADDDTPNAVSIGSVIDAVEPDQSGSATLSLERAALTDTTVTYTVAGTATSGTDYAALTGTAVILAGTTSTQIEIAPIDDLVQEGVETVALTLTGASGDASIRLGSATSAIVAIGDDEAPPPGGFSADFEFGTEGFTYADGAFRSTDEDSFEDGVATGGVLRVILGGGSGRDTITGMSGGWTTSFESAAGQAASLDLVYRIAMTAELDLEEIAEVLVSLDGSEFFVASLEATDSENEVLDTGFVEATLDLGTLDAGTHTLTIGGFLNQRTRSNEIATLEFESLELILGTTDSPADDDRNLAISAPDLRISASEVTEVAFDVTGIDADATARVTVSDGVNQVVSDVLAADGRVTLDLSDLADGRLTTAVTATDGDGATATVGGPEVTLAVVEAPSFISFDFEDGPGTFIFSDDALGGADNSEYVSGSAPNGLLQVQLGGVDRQTILDMSGGWTTTFELGEAQEVTLDEITYRIAMSDGLDPGEIGQAILSIDGDEFLLRSFEAGDNDVVGEDTGLQSLADPLSLGVFDAGVHTLTLGGALNQKTRPNEIATVQFDDLVLSFSDPATDDF